MLTCLSYLSFTTFLRAISDCSDEVQSYQVSMVLKTLQFYTHSIILVRGSLLYSTVISMKEGTESVWAHHWVPQF